MKRNATSVWRGTGQEGAGTLTTPSGVLNQTPYGFKARFVDVEGKSGTNPEELLGAAHAGCFNMQLSFMIASAGHVAEELTTVATVSVDQVEHGFEITSIVLNLTGKVPGMTEEAFKKLAEDAKAGCPLSKALKAVPTTLNATFHA